VDVPEHLISEEHINNLMAERQPHYISESSTGFHIEPKGDFLHPSDDPSEGILQLRLSNGIRINARRTLNEPKAAMLRMVAAGKCWGRQVS